MKADYPVMEFCVTDKKTFQLTNKRRVDSISVDHIVQWPIRDEYIDPITHTLHLGSKSAKLRCHRSHYYW